MADSPRILIIRPSALGDVARTVPALVTLRRAHPDATIDWLVQDTFTDVVAPHPALNEVIPFARSRFAKPSAALEFFRWVKTLKARNYDMVFDLQGLFRSGFITRRTGAPKRIGFANAAEFAHLAYTEKHHVDRTLHTVDRMLGLLDSAGYETVRDMNLYISAADQQWLNETCGNERYACIAPTARWLCKCWPADRFAEIARRLLDQLNVSKLVFIASPSERDQVQPIIDALGPDAPVLFPKTTVGQMSAVISRCEMLVCNDSGPLHIAVGFDRPIVTIYGPTNPGTIGPYQRADTVVQAKDITLEQMSQYRKVRDDQSLISKVTVEDVWNKVIEQTSEI